MSLRLLIESLGLSPGELRGYLLQEVDELLAAGSPEARREELGDVLFALAALGWSLSGEHLELDLTAIEPKIRQRLRQHAAVTRYPRRYLHDSIATMRFDVVHLVAGLFGGRWKEFDPLKNGTVAEVSLLTDAPSRAAGGPGNHCLLSFGDTAWLEYEVLHAASDLEGGNTVVCRIPDFLFARAKRELAYRESGDYLALQVLAALEGVRLADDAFLHFHSWENGFLVASPEFRAATAGLRTIFSPYLTIGPLRRRIEASPESDWTMSPAELAVADGFELELAAACDRVVVENESDRAWFAERVDASRVELRSFSSVRAARFASAPLDERRLRFLAGGRPAREKGFVELCREFARVRDWAATAGVEVELELICREPNEQKGADYLRAIEREVEIFGLADIVRIETKLPLDRLRARIALASALVAPSLYDPFCLMPTYATEARRPSFVSRHAGVAANLTSPQFLFDPLVEGDLARAVAAWYRERPEFGFAVSAPPFDGLYLDAGAP